MYYTDDMIKTHFTRDGRSTIHTVRSIWYLQLTREATAVDCEVCKGKLAADRARDARRKAAKESA